MLSQEDISLIEKKLSGNLTESEIISFDEKYASNMAFKKEALTRSDLLAGIDALRKHELKNELKSIFNKPSTDTLESIEEQPTTTKKRRIPWYWVAAAAAIIPVLVYLGINTANNDLSNDELFTQYFEPVDNIITKRNDSPEDFISLGMHFYDIKQYDSATHYLQKVDNNYTAGMYLGISQLAMGQVTQSLQTFTLVESKSQNKIIIEYAQWFKALAYLKNNDIEEARKILIVLKNKPDSDYEKAAKSLLEAL